VLMLRLAFSPDASDSVAIPLPVVMQMDNVLFFTLIIYKLLITFDEGQLSIMLKEQ